MIIIIIIIIIIFKASFSSIPNKKFVIKDYTVETKQFELYLI